jgi:ribosomal protein S18 acetylase RimI-like enzyme
MIGKHFSMKLTNHTKDFIIRPFQLSDQDAAKTLILEGLSERFNPFRPELNTDVNDIAKNFDVFLVAYVNGELIATGGLKFETETSAKVVRMSTAKAFRGQGIASQVLGELEHLAKARGITHLTLVTNQNWTDAIQLYERRGFRVVGHYQDDWGFRGVRFEKNPL